MKALIFVLLSLIPLNLVAQNYEYCTLQQIGGKPIYIEKDSGTKDLLKDENGQEFKDLLKALIYLEKDKWEYVLSYAKCANNVSGNSVREIGASSNCQDIENFIIFKRKTTGGSQLNN